MFEKNNSPGGKINQVNASGFRFDTGPSLLTLPDIVEELFKKSGAPLDQYLSIKKPEPLCRYFYQDGTVFNCYQDEESTVREIQKIAPEDAGNYRRFLAYSKDLYNRTNNSFLQNPLYDYSDLRSLNFSDIFKIDALQTVSNRVEARFNSSYLQQFFKRFTTYNGSSPFKSPATLNVIPHVELSLGGYYLDGGMYSLVEGLENLAKKNGGKFKYASEVDQICIDQGRTSGIRLKKGSYYDADIVISNSDANETFRHLIANENVSFIKRKKMDLVEPSCSGFVLLLGSNKQYDHLAHHNIFFSNNYKNEFNAIFNRNIMPPDPTIYIANTSVSNPEHAIEGGSNFFVLINAPYLSEKWDWSKQTEPYAHFIISELEKRGLNGLRESITYQQYITPADFYQRYRSNKGSIYGTSSNSKLAAFMRPKNKARAIPGLYLTGGSTHPGGGIPLVILSAFHTVELIRRYE